MAERYPILVGIGCRHSKNEAYEANLNITKLIKANKVIRTLKRKSEKYSGKKIVYSYYFINKKIKKCKKKIKNDYS